MFFLYVLQSEKNNRYYIGSCEDIDARLVRHNAGATPSTKSGRPWKVVYSEEFATRNEAMAREKEVKAKKCRKYIEFLINRSVS